MAVGSATRLARVEPRRAVMISVCLVGAAASVVGEMIVLLRELFSGEAGDSGLGQDFYNLWFAARTSPQEPIYAKAIAEFKQYPGDPIHLAQFVYPPFAALVVKPLAGLPFAGAEAVWLLIGAACLAAACAVAIRCLESPVERSLAIVLAATAPSTWWSLQQGQMNVPLLLCMLAAGVALEKRRDLLAGILVGVAAAVKIYPGILIVYFIWAGRWRAALAAVLAGGICTLAGFVLAGSDALDYLRVVLPNQLVPSTGYDNMGLPGVFQRFFVPNVFDSQVANLPIVAAVAPKLGALLLVAVTLAREPGGRGAAPVWSALVLTALLPLIVTTAWPATAIYAMPPLWVAAACLLRPGAGLPTKALSASAILLLYVSPLLRGTVYPPLASAAAIRSHDPVFYVWGLDVTLGLLLSWWALLILREVPRWSGRSTFAAES